MEQLNSLAMDENALKEVDDHLAKAKIQRLFESNSALRKAFPDLFSKACSGQGSRAGFVKNEDILLTSATKDGKDGDGDSRLQDVYVDDIKKDANDGQDEIVGVKSKQRLGKKKSRNAMRKLSKKPMADGIRATIIKQSKDAQVKSDDSILKEGYEADDEKDADDAGQDKKSRKAVQKLDLEGDIKEGI